MIDEHVNRMIAQVAIGRQFTRISPAEIYRQACEIIAGTGIQRFSQLCRQRARYQDELKEYIYSRDSEDPASLHLPSDEATPPHRRSHASVDFDTVPKFRSRTWRQMLNWPSGTSDCWPCSISFFRRGLHLVLRYDVVDPMRSSPPLSGSGRRSAGRRRQAMRPPGDGLGAAGIIPCNQRRSCPSFCREVSSPP
jgi:hypothetical protein